MRLATDWTALALPRITTLPRPVFLRAQSLPAHHSFPLHRHDWNQLIYAKAGTLQVVVEDTWYVITPEQAIWVPTGVRHTTGALSQAEFRTLYVADTPPLQMPQTCTVLAVSPLLRTLILELETIGRQERAGHCEPDDYIERINVLVIDQLHRLKTHNFCLPWPRSATLRQISEAVYEAPDDARSLDHWAAEFGMSSRTLTRRFEKEVGLSLRAWRHRLRLFRALEWLGSGRDVTGIALDLGYASPSAFSLPPAAT